MKILAPGDDVVSPSGHMKRKHLGTEHIPETHQEELHQKRKKKKRRRTEGIETNEQQQQQQKEEEDDDNRGSCQELASEEAGQPATQETTERKKKKKKRRRTESVETNEEQQQQQQQKKEEEDEDDNRGSCQELALEEAGQPATQETTERKKKKKRRRTEGIETNEQQQKEEEEEEEDNRGSCQELALEEAGQPATQETTECKKKKKKKKKTIKQEQEEGEEMVAIADEEEGEPDDCEVSVVVETSIPKKKKKRKHKRRAEEREPVTGSGEDGDDTDGGGAVVEATDAADHGATEAAPAQDDVPLHEERRTQKKRTKEMTDNEREQWSRVDPVLLSELQTYIPDAESRAYDIVNKMLHQDLPRFREFKKKGIQLRWGRFLKEENLKLQQNARNFLALTGITTTSQLFYPERYPNQAEAIRRQRVLHSFMVKMAEDIPRPCYKVYVRGKKMFDDSNYLGRFTDEENHKLQKLQRLHGNNWKTIAEGMGRSLCSIQKRFNMIAMVSGTWSEDEEDLLMRATRLQLEKVARDNDAGARPQQLWVTKRQLHHRLPWKAISEMVVQRSWVQCREKWFGFLKAKLEDISNTDENGTVESIPLKIALINTLYVMDLEDPAEIDWEKVADRLGNTTPRAAQHIFHKLKMTSVPHAPAISFCELIEFLHNKVLPMLKSRAEGLSEQTQQEVVKDRYLLSDLFDQSGGR